jgi:hypothetical protein
MATIRRTVQDFLSAVRSQGNVAQSSSPNSHSARINPDGFSVQVSVTKAGVTTVLYPKIVYNMGCQSVGTQGDANQDSMTIFSADGAPQEASPISFRL